MHQKSGHNLDVEGEGIPQKSPCPPPQLPIHQALKSPPIRSSCVSGTWQGEDKGALLNAVCVEDDLVGDEQLPSTLSGSVAGPRITLTWAE